MAERKVALVTGSGRRRVGAYVADALADRGYSIIVHYLTSAAEALATVADYRTKGLEAEAMSADLTDEAQVRTMVDGAMAKFGQIDALVHCAATWPRKSLDDTRAADVNYCYETNTLGTFLICQRVGLAMTKQFDGGAIVTIGDWAVERPYLNYAAYFASKGSIPTMTRTFAVELGTRNPRVRVNCILPGPVLMPPDLSPLEREEAIAGTLVKREGTPENVAHAAVFLLENDFVTGVCLPVDGGRSIFAPDSA